MPAKTVPINPEVLSWVVRESGYSTQELAEKLGVADEVIRAWMQGESQPRRGQFSILTKFLRRPSAIFFLPEPPTGIGIPTELRRAPGKDAPPLSPKELRVIRRARRLQALLGTLSQETTETLGLPVADISLPPARAAALVRNWLDVSVTEQFKWPDERTAFLGWRRALAGRSIAVMQVELGRDGIRGFISADPRFPIIGVNTFYNYAARIFTTFGSKSCPGETRLL